MYNGMAQMGAADFLHGQYSPMHQQHQQFVLPQQQLHNPQMLPPGIVTQQQMPPTQLPPQQQMPGSPHNQNHTQMQNGHTRRGKKKGPGSPVNTVPTVGGGGVMISPTHYQQQQQHPHHPTHQHHHHHHHHHPQHHSHHPHQHHHHHHQHHGEEGEDDDAVPSTRSARAPPEMSRPCMHNAWDDVRTRRHAKILQCRECLAKWKLAMPVPRCTHFLHGHCEKADQCQMLHVYKKKADKEKPAEPPMAPRNEDDEVDGLMLADSIKSAPGTNNDHWRQWFKEDDVAHFAKSDGGSRYTLVEPASQGLMDELRDEKADLRRRIRGQRVPQVDQQGSGNIGECTIPVPHMVPSPTSSADACPPPLMSPVSHPGGVGPPSPIGGRSPYHHHHVNTTAPPVVVPRSPDNDGSRSPLAVRRGLHPALPIATSNPPVSTPSVHYNVYSTASNHSPTHEPVSPEHPQRQESMPSLLHTPSANDSMPNMQALGLAMFNGHMSRLYPSSPQRRCSVTEAEAHLPHQLLHTPKSTTSEAISAVENFVQHLPPHSMSPSHHPTSPNQQGPYGASEHDMEQQRLAAMAAGYVMSHGASPHAVSPNCAVSPVSQASSAVQTPVNEQNGGVHAMTEDELDKHMEKIQPVLDQKKRMDALQRRSGARGTPSSPAKSPPLCPVSPISPTSPSSNA